MPQSVSEQEEHVECSTIQNNHKSPTSGIESDSTDIQINKEIDDLPVQCATEIHSVSKIQRNIFILIMIISVIITITIVSITIFFCPICQFYKNGY